MATATNYTPSRSEAGEEISTQQSVIPVPTRSFIVGRYDEYGRRTSQGEFTGGERAGNQYRSKLLQSMRNNGQLMPGFVMGPNGPMRQVAAPKAVAKRGAKTQVKTGKKVKTAQVLFEPSSELVVEESPTVEQLYEAPVKAAPERRPAFSIVFVIDSGKIKSSADAVLETPEALVLVYRDEDAVSYVPEKGSTLTIIAPDKREIEVMYLGLQFEWYNTRQQLLVFMKTQVEE